MNDLRPLCRLRLYPILDVDAARSRALAPLDVLRAWLAAGVGLIQLRAKSISSGEFLRLSEAAVSLAADASALIVINDRADVAVMSGARGVHVGQDDLTPAQARTIVGPDRLVGLSTHRDDQVVQGRQEDVSYLAIGPVFATSSKVDPDPAVGIAGVGRAVQLVEAANLPIVAIGGITLATAPSVIDAGASAVAVISDLLAGDVEQRVRDYLAALR